MGKYIQELISISSPSLCSSIPEIPFEFKQFNRKLVLEFQELLQSRNGLFAFESALHIFPAGIVDFKTDGYDFAHWNRQDVWRKDYGITDVRVFFAEDLFGAQWALSTTGILKFDPEIGEFVDFAECFEEWAGKILTDYEVETGWPLANVWQHRYGAIAPYCRLIPKIPFVLGGDYSIDNLYAVDGIEGIKFRADIARQLRHIPDGEPVQFVLREE